MAARLRIVVLSLIPLTLSGCAALGAGSPGLYNVDGGGIGLSGFDPVTYFPEGGSAPGIGQPSIRADHEGITYRFASEANLALFQDAPERFAPAYGGWCAWAMLHGDRVEVDPRSFLIEDGRLLLFYDGFFGDTRASWLEAEDPSLMGQADSHWMALIQGDAGTASDHQP